MAPNLLLLLLLLQVLCFEYTLTSKAPFPTQLNEAMKVYKALLANYKPQNIAVLGASAGGGLVPALFMQAQQQQLPLPAALLLMSPWGDMTKSGDTMTTLNGYDPMLQYELTLQQPAMAYVNGDAKLLQDTRVSPLKADVKAFSRFPPTLTQTGLRDAFLSQAILMHRKLRAAGVDASFSPWEAMWHIFQGNNELPEAQAAHHEMAAFLVKHLGLAVGSS
jgi:acetyl esterase/lipase